MDLQRGVLPVPVASGLARRALLAGALAGLLISLVVAPPASARGGITPPPSIARVWNEQLLAAIRTDLPKPPAHARNLFHLSVAMWDAWAAYDAVAEGYLVREKHHAPDVAAARAEAISYAAYRLLKQRFPLDSPGTTCHPNAAVAQDAFDVQLRALGYDPAFTATDGDSPAALGNRIGAAVVREGSQDGANEGASACYLDDTNYAPRNPPLIFKLPGAGDVLDPNRWQPLAFDFLITQNGIPLGAGIQAFVGVGWGRVTPFALEPSDRDALTGLYLDPGPPPQLGGAGDATVKAAIVELIRLSSQLDVAEGELVDVSPGALFNNSLGADDGAGHAVNPVTGEPYAPLVLERADVQRVIVDFWADGPRSETPPGHWNVIANTVADHPASQDNRSIGGDGPLVDALEWDVKVYLALNGALHDAAIWAWGAKQVRDSSRPITLIRYMAGRGQSSDPSAPSYHPQGLPLVPGLIEIITPATARRRGRHAHLSAFAGEVAIRAWRGARPDGEAGGVGWRRAVEWMPYMQPNFVTPPFPGYTSGHSAFSRAAAEVLAALTGSAFFPGGLATFVAPRDEFGLVERGPTATVTLQWATYHDAADQAAVSRRLGGIHPSYDDYPSRMGGAEIGRRAVLKARRLYDGVAEPVNVP